MSATDRKGRPWVWVAAVVVSFLALWLLRAILLPFVAGFAIAFLLNPLAERLQRAGLSRLVATILITLGFFLLAVILLVVLVPVLEGQVVHFVQKVPDYVNALGARTEPLWRAVKDRLSPEDIGRLRGALGDYAGTAAGWAGKVARGLLSGSLAVVNVLSLVFITPVVTFYLLRDWPKVTERVDRWLPRPHAATIKRLLGEVDTILSGYVRGQALVCLSLAALYGIGLTVVGLDLGLVVGLVAGMLSFIPYLGSISGFVVGVGLAFAQTSDWLMPAMVAGVFIIGNIIEGNVLAPKLVGEKIGLHAVWVIFSLLAGGTLFGFLGVLLALPVAAVVGVLARFALERYMDSPLYQGDPGADKQG